MRTLNKTLPLPFQATNNPFIFKSIRDRGLASYENRVRFFWLLVGVIIMSLITYIYAIAFTARHVGERQQLQNEIAQLSTNLNALEFESIELRNNITLELARQYGFSEAE